MRSRPPAPGRWPLADGFARFSARSREQRFLAPGRHLSAAELRYLTDVDHHDHEAIGALDRAGRGVGVAGYIRSRHDPRSGEIAVTVVDAWQGRGLGTELTRQLADLAGQAGISTFTALVTAENVAARGVQRTMRGSLTRRDRASLEYEIPCWRAASTTTGSARSSGSDGYDALPGSEGRGI